MNTGNDKILAAIAAGDIRTLATVIVELQGTIDRLQGEVMAANAIAAAHKAEADRYFAAMPRIHEQATTAAR